MTTRKVFKLPCQKSQRKNHAGMCQAPGHTREASSKPFARRLSRRILRLPLCTGSQLATGEARCSSVASLRPTRSRSKTRRSQVRAIHCETLSWTPLPPPPRDASFSAEVRRWLSGCPAHIHYSGWPSSRARSLGRLGAVAARCTLTSSSKSRPVRSWGAYDTRRAPARY